MNNKDILSIVVNFVDGTSTTIPVVAPVAEVAPVATEPVATEPVVEAPEAETPAVETPTV